MTTFFQLPGTLTNATPAVSQTGKISWFGGPQDPSSGPTTASGAPVSNPGIAVYNQQTLGGWWLLKMPNGNLTVIQQTDIGPAPWTGRKFDFTYTALQGLGYTTGNFPTDSTATGFYLGKSNQQVANNLMPALNALGANIPNITGWLSKTFKNGPQFAVSPSQGSKQGPFDTGSVDTHNQPVQPGGPQNAISQMGDLISMLTSPQFWIRLLEVVAGAVLVFMGLRSMTGSSNDPIQVAARAVTP